MITIISRIYMQLCQEYICQENVHIFVDVDANYLRVLKAKTNCT